VVLPSNLQQQLLIQLMLQQQQQLSSQQLQMLVPGTPPGETGGYFVVQPGTQVSQQHQMLSLNTQLAALPNVAGPAAAPTPPASPPEAKEAPGSPPTKGSRSRPNTLKSLAVNVTGSAIMAQFGGGSSGGGGNVISDL